MSNQSNNQNLPTNSLNKEEMSEKVANWKKRFDNWTKDEANAEQAQPWLAGHFGWSRHGY